MRKTLLWEHPKPITTIPESQWLGAKKIKSGLKKFFQRIY